MVFLSAKRLLYIWLSMCGLSCLPRLLERGVGHLVWCWVSELAADDWCVLSLQNIPIFPLPQHHLLRHVLASEMLDAWVARDYCFVWALICANLLLPSFPCFPFSLLFTDPRRKFAAYVFGQEFHTLNDLLPLELHGL